MADSKARAELLDIILTKVHHFFFQQFHWLIFFKSFICDFLLVLLVAKPKRLAVHRVILVEIHDSKYLNNF